jgi:hypothetical protein
LALITRNATSSWQRRSIAREERTPIAYRDDGWGRAALDPAMMVALFVYACATVPLTLTLTPACVLERQ